MNRILLAVAALMFAALVGAQAPAAPKAPNVVGKTGGAICDMILIADGSAVVNGVEYDVGYSYAFAPALPMADVNDNHAKMQKVLSVASQQQDKGGPYDLELSEYRQCDGSGAVKIDDGSILIKGMTLAGATKVQDEFLNQAKAINDRTKGRSKDKNSMNHDHTKAKKVKRNDVGVKDRS